jgi:hypothetical protein
MFKVGDKVKMFNSQGWTISNGMTGTIIGFGFDPEAKVSAPVSEQVKVDWNDWTEGWGNDDSTWIVHDYELQLIPKEEKEEIWGLQLKEVAKKLPNFTGHMTRKGADLIFTMGGAGEDYVMALLK